MADDAHDELAGLDLSPTAVLVYRLLIDQYAMSVASISRASNAKSELVAEALEQLRDAGLITRANDDPYLYQTVDPRDAISARIAVLGARLERARSSVRGLGDRYDVTRSSRTAGIASADSEVLQSASELAMWYSRLQQRATSEFLVFDRPPYSSAPVESVEQASMDRGVTVRAVYVPASFDRSGARDEIDRLARSGERARVVSALPVKLVIADRSTLLLSLRQGHETGYEALLTRSPELVALFLHLFEETWNRGVDVAAYLSVPVGRDAGPGAGLAPLDRELIALIGTGLTDDDIASRLGISERSVRRRCASLMQSLGAVNRFQFGLFAARRGLI